jgi:hypothetical protein
MRRFKKKSTGKVTVTKKKASTTPSLKGKRRVSINPYGETNPGKQASSKVNLEFW